MGVLGADASGVWSCSICSFSGFLDSGFLGSFALAPASPCMISSMNFSLWLAAWEAPFVSFFVDDSTRFLPGERQCLVSLVASFHSFPFLYLNFDYSCLSHE
jgi:hypothetical protein